MNMADDIKSFMENLEKISRERVKKAQQDVTPDLIAWIESKYPQIKGQFTIQWKEI